MRLTLCAIAATLLAACSAAKTWTVPADLMQGNPAELVKQAAAAGQLRELMEAAETKVFDVDEERMAQFLRAALATGRLSESETSTAEWMLHDVCEVNAPGSEAADFRFGTPEKSENTLLTHLPGKPLVMILYDPDCDHCREVIAELADLGQQIDVLAVCIDSTFKRWEVTRSALPGDWVKGFDRSGITENDIYVVRTLPSIYLLDSSRHVVLKNPSVERLLTTLKDNKPQ